MGRWETADWVRVRRHKNGAGLYVYIPAEELQRAGIADDAAPLMVRRYGTKKGDVVLRFRVGEPTEWDMKMGYASRRRKAKAP